MASYFLKNGTNISYVFSFMEICLSRSVLSCNGRKICHRDNLRGFLAICSILPLIFFLFFFNVYDDRTDISKEI